MKKKLDDIHIVSATYLQDYVIRFVFDDGVVNDIDFHPFLSKVSQNPMVSKYLDVTLFKEFEIVPGDEISWNDYEMCYGFETLYRGYIEKTPRLMNMTFSSNKKSKVRITRAFKIEEGRKDIRKNKGKAIKTADLWK